LDASRFAPHDRERHGELWRSASRNRGVLEPQIGGDSWRRGNLQSVQHSGRQSFVFAGRAPPAHCVESTAEREIAKPHARDWTRRGLVDPEVLHFGEGGECGQRNEGGGD
jgi:hypothetical protein